MFPRSNVKRTGRERFLRNVLIAIGNSGDVTLVPDAERLLDDPSPLIRGAAVWALSQLLPRGEFVALRRDDADAGVMEEWQIAID
jgi:epoxyqueuosine reductase